MTISNIYDVKIYFYNGLNTQTVFILLKYICMYHRLISLVGRVFANGPGDLGSIPDCVMQKTLKMVLDTSLVRIKGKVDKSREKSNDLPYTSV